jgi:predicted secreted protein
VYFEGERGGDMMKIRKGLIVTILATFCLAVTLFVTVPTKSQSGVYDPWVDVNDDGSIDMADISIAIDDFMTSGAPMTKAGILYDSGWIDITDMAGQNITITHGLNITDWNDESIDVSITGKTSTEGELQRYVGLTGQIQGWNKTYGGTNDDHASALVQTSDGGYALAGYTNSFGAGGYDFWLVKTDASGTMQWNITYGGTNEDLALALVQTSGGGYALAGSTRSFGVSNADAWLVKTDEFGNMQWNKTYGGANYEFFDTIVQTGDGGYALAGYTNSFGAGGYDFWLVKTDASGNAQWNKTYGGTSDDSATSVVQTADGGYALAGSTSSFGAGGYDFWLVKTDASGNAQWNKTYGGTSDDMAFAFVQTSDGGYALAGYTKSFGAGSHDFWLVKTDSAGNAQWNKTYGGTSMDYATALVKTVDGGYALAGYTTSFGVGPNDFWLVKTDASGNVGGFESGLALIDSSANTVTLYRGATDAYWNYVRVRVWKVKESP